MTENSQICLIGDIVVDISLKTSRTPTKLRFGGIIHAARALWAMGIPFEVAYFAPEYLDAQISDYLTNLGCIRSFKLGNVTGAPYLFLIEEVKEIGDQGYDFILRDEINITYNEGEIEKFINQNYSDCLFISGNYEMGRVINHLKGNIHIDIANNISDFTFLTNLSKKIETIFISTSSNIFKKYFNGTFKDFIANFKNYSNYLILKENRGGSRGVNLRTYNITPVGAQTRPVIHSIGVGDVFDTCYVINKPKLRMKEVLSLSSWMAAEYAQTTYPDDFKIQVERLFHTNIKDLIKLKSISIPWEKRNNIHIYIAAPDFDHINTKHIDLLHDALLYHNFSPHRPVKENGQMEIGATKKRKQLLFAKDMILLEKCQILVAVLIFDDPGTLIEIGLAAAKGLPTMVYDPYQIATNCMLTELPTLITNDLDTLITEIFIQSNSLLSE